MRCIKEKKSYMSGGIFISNGDQGLQLYNRSFLGRTHIGGDLFTKVLVLKQPILVLWCFETLNLILSQDLLANKKRCQE